MNCKVSGKLRFHIGDVVQLNFDGKWTRAKITSVWENANPYRVETEDGSSCYVPMDSNAFLKEL